MKMVYMDDMRRGYRLKRKIGFCVRLELKEFEIIYKITLHRRLWRLN